MLRPVSARYDFCEANPVLSRLCPLKQKLVCNAEHMELCFTIAYVNPGMSLRLGITGVPGTVNFELYQHATS